MASLAITISGCELMEERTETTVLTLKEELLFMQEVTETLDKCHDYYNTASDLLSKYIQQIGKKDIPMSKLIEIAKLHEETCNKIKHTIHGIQTKGKLRSELESRLKWALAEIGSGYYEKEQGAIKLREGIQESSLSKLNEGRELLLKANELITAGYKEIVEINLILKGES